MIMCRIIAKGASGGLGLGNPVPALVSYASTVRAVFSLTGGTQLYFLIGQEGLSVHREVSRPAAQSPPSISLIPPRRVHATSTQLIRSLSILHCSVDDHIS